MKKPMSTSEVARMLNCRPRDISDGFYSRALDDRTCPLVGRHRAIPPHYVPVIRRYLIETGKLREESAAS